ncbi:urease accessory protein UreE [Thermocoleostomius sinensis]|uniref:Urease accessory protein UreE n=1 Tax=Thermocoleostomius sinensis A174 TaxID=2016057 RepID=A0A9E8ZAQ4_9CYAN|nr:urease accessory protein UreE [Thermocoleostomius sinensis]WAL59725.1 urease accessory protein UreE [Thermocoleostomius sinensis A174]
MLTLTHRSPVDPKGAVSLTLSLTAEERTRSRHYFQTDDGQGVYLRLPRGTVLRHGDVLQSEDRQTLVQIVAKPEPVMTVTAATTIDLLRAAYHLGNRHVPLEVTETYLRLSPDPVLKSMLEQMRLHVTEAQLPFEPEAGAYGHTASHGHAHAPSATHVHDHVDHDHID